MVPGPEAPAVPGTARKYSMFTGLAPDLRNSDIGNRVKTLFLTNPLGASAKSENCLPLQANSVSWCVSDLKLPAILG